MPIRLIQGASFDAETTRLLGLAYERACEDLAPDVTVREAVAKRIIAAAKGGERDVERLINYGLGKDDMLADAGAQRGRRDWRASERYNAIRQGHRRLRARVCAAGSAYY